jgi:osmotically-inducible protein OsmY
MAEQRVRSDEDIKRDIIDELFWDERVDASNINVEVREGVVTLSGTVPNYLARKAAYRDTWLIRDVFDVENMIAVTYPDTIEVPNDADLRDMSRSTLVWNADINSKDIDVRVTNGEVVLTGTVDAFWKKWKAEELVSEVRGVIDVQNELAIVPTKSRLDKEIAEDIESALRRSLYVDSESVNVVVENGKVKLTGRVSAWYDRLKAEEIASHTAGVTDMDNKLTVQGKDAD